MKSLQYGVTTVLGNITVSSIDLSKAVLLFTWSSYDTSYDVMVRGTLVDSTTINFDAPKTPSSGLHICWYLIEFAAGVTVQRGTAYYNNNELEANITISSVDVSRSFVIVTTRTYGENCLMTGTLTSSTNLYLRTLYWLADTYVSWQVVTFI